MGDPDRPDWAPVHFDEHAVADVPRLGFICACLTLLPDTHQTVAGIALGVAAGLALRVAWRTRLTPGWGSRRTRHSS